jgi:hypothetical protein
MAWGKVFNVAKVFFGEPLAPAGQGDHPFGEWRRYVKLHRLPGGRRHRRTSGFRLETALALQVLRYGGEVPGLFLSSDN